MNVSKYVLVGYNLLDSKEFIRLRNDYSNYSKYLFVPDNLKENKILMNNTLEFSEETKYNYFKTNSVKVLDTASLSVIDMNLLKAIEEKVLGFSRYTIDYSNNTENKKLTDVLKKDGYIGVNVLGNLYPYVGTSTSHLVPMFYNGKVAWDTSGGVEITIIFNRTYLDIVVNLINFSCSVFFNNRILVRGSNLSFNSTSKSMYRIAFYGKNNPKDNSNDVVDILKGMGFNLGEGYMSYKNKIYLALSELSKLNHFNITNGIEVVYMEFNGSVKGMTLVFPPSLKEIKFKFTSLLLNRNSATYNFVFSKATKKSVYGSMIKRMQELISSYGNNCKVTVSLY